MGPGSTQLLISTAEFSFLAFVIISLEILNPFVYVNGQRWPATPRNCGIETVYLTLPALNLTRPLAKTLFGCTAH